MSPVFNECMESIYGSDEQCSELDLFTKKFFKVLKKAEKLPGIISLDLDFKLNQTAELTINTISPIISGGDLSVCNLFSTCFGGSLMCNKML